MTNQPASVPHKFRGLPHDDGAALAWAMVEAAPDALVVVDEGGVIDFVNARAEQMLGYDRAELVGQDVELLVPKGLRGQHRAHRTRYRTNPEVRAIGSGLDLVALRRDGRELPVEISLSPMRIDGRLRIIAAVRDISERAQLEARDREIRRGVDLIEDALFMFDADTLTFRYVNVGAASQLGYSRGELLTMTPLHIKPEHTESSFRELLLPLSEGERPSVHFTTLHRHRSGRDIPVDVVLQALPLRRDGSMMYVEAVRDISERLAHENDLAMAQQRSAVLEDRERIARQLHDDVISQLLAIGLMIDSTTAKVDNEEVSARLTKAVERIDDSIKDIRAVLYGSGRETRPGPGAHDRLTELAEEFERSVGCTVDLEMRGDLDSLDDEVDQQLITVVREAMTNTLKHAQATELTIDVELSGHELRVRVADDGVGFDPQRRPSAGPDTGHGLDNLLHRARQLGGTLSVDSAPGRGTQVVWVVPVSR